MATLLHSVGNLLPYYLLSYSALLGMELYQSFINTKICLQALPPREFIALQKRLFPVYFGCQIGFTAITAATCPPHSVVSLKKDVWDLVLLGIVLVTISPNSSVYGPSTTKASLARRALHENKENAPDYPDSDAGKLQRANRNFSHNHAMTIHLNAIALVATIWYGFSLSSSIMAGF